MTVITEQYLSNTASMLYWSYVINCGIWYFISWSSLYHVMSELNIYVWNLDECVKAFSYQVQPDF